MGVNETNKLVKSALLLTAGGLISKVLSAGYRVPLQNLTGDIGFYIYQQIYPILGIALMLSLYGFPSAISKMAMDLKRMGKKLTFKTFHLPIILILLCINATLFLFLLLNADLLAVWIGDERLAGTYRFSAFIFLVIPFTALLRGVFQSNQYMKPVAFSQIGEQIVRVFIIVGAAVVISTQQINLYKIGQAAVWAAILGSITALFILVIFYRNKQLKKEETNHPVPWNYYVNTLLILGLAATLNHMVLLVIQFADTFTLLPSLLGHGLDKQTAMEAKGVFDRGQPLIQLGIVLGSSFALALLPSISQKRLEDDPETFYFYIRGALKFSLYLAVGACIGLIIIFKEVNELLYQNAEGTRYLQILVSAIVFASIAITASSILQGLGYVKRTAGFILIAFFVKWIANQTLVPWIGIIGAALATTVSLLLLCIIVSMELRRKVPGLHFYKQINWKVLSGAAGLMIIYLAIGNFIISFMEDMSRWGLLVYVVFISFTGGAIYIFCMIRWKAFTIKELRMLPASNFFIRIYKERNKI
ncbi:polysaccharide biosynthesis protein [Virgibacillus sp. SK37]|uniref:putative polysaccharide biosynthesis protein n=1 Tax=Virgibacillus sp. SK37 TaxID=403957 RepID=UPI0004D14508|nr:polysaccharide biosynthesis protein [Virgibacillus sp. SK37]AIF41996.1 low temperature requirement B protein [Virgibacillus sp. SK37]